MSISLSFSPPFVPHLFISLGAAKRALDGAMDDIIHDKKPEEYPSWGPVYVNAASKGTASLSLLLSQTNNEDNSYIFTY